MAHTTRKFKMQVEGMTCTGCEEHVTNALKSIGAVNINVNYHHGDATFELPSGSYIKEAKASIEKAKYKPGEVEEIRLGETKICPHQEDYDFIIIGSGSAAFSAAIKAVGYGARVAMVERGTVGGTCVNIGCVPSKTMLRSGEINRLAKINPFLGLNTSAESVNLEKLVEQKDQLVEELRQQKYIDLIEDYGFDLIKGDATFVNEKTIEVNGVQLTAHRFLIATGASPAIPNIPGLNDVPYLTSTSLLELKELPKSLAVIGSGYIGLELGQLFHNLGVEVTLMQRSQRLLKEYDPEVSEMVEKFIAEQGICSMTGVTFEQILKNDGKIQIHSNVNGEKIIIEAEQLLVATGRRPNTETLNLRLANVLVGTHGEIRVDENLKTTNSHIYAAGDVILGPQFVYVAAYQGSMVANNALGNLARKVNLEAVPGVTFTNPSIATVGLTEQHAKEKGYEVQTSVLPLDAVPRALVNRETTGVFKIVVETETKKVLGVHVVAENAGEVIYAATLAVKFGLTIEDLRDTMAPYLTMAEGIKLAALTFDKDVKKLSCCAG